MDGKKIAVMGAGANGASIGADLTRAGEDVVLIEQWPEHVEAMRRNGLRINLPEESLHVPVRTIHLCEVATLRHDFDVVLLLVKAYDSRWAAHLIEPYLAPNGLLIGVQNGMTIDTIAEVVGRDRTLGCVIEVTAAMYDPGIVERQSPASRSWFAVGSFDPSTVGREDEIASLLRHVGSVDVVDDIRAAKWMKLVNNATTMVTTAILGLPMVGAASIPEMRQFMLRSGQEALDVALGLGNRALPIFGLTADALSQPDKIVETLLDTIINGFVMPDSKTTVLQDWMKGRHCEVNEIHGLVASTHRKLGGRAPANEAVMEVARRIEHDEAEPCVDNLNLLLELAGPTSH